MVAHRVDTQFTGSPKQVADRLEQLQEASGADELIITTITHDTPTGSGPTSCSRRSGSGANGAPWPPGRHLAPGTWDGTAYGAVRRAMARPAATAPAPPAAPTPAVASRAGLR